MSVTPLRSPISRQPGPSWTPGRRRARPVPAIDPAIDPPLTVRFEITLDGESRHEDAVEVLEALQRLADRLGSASVRVRPELAGDVTTSGISRPKPSTVDSDELPASTVVGPPPGPDEPVSERTVWIRADSRIVVARDEPVDFTRVEYDLLLFFARHPRRVFTRAQLLQIVWGYSHAGERTVDVHIRRLRSKLGEIPLVTTVRGVGYRLADDADLRIVHVS